MSVLAPIAPWLAGVAHRHEVQRLLARSVRHGSVRLPNAGGDLRAVGLPVALNWDRDVPPDPVKLADAVQTIAANGLIFRNARGVVPSIT